MVAFAMQFSLRRQHGYLAILCTVVAGCAQPAAENTYNISQIDSCQILFIAPSEAKRLDQLLSHLNRRSVLTVGDSRDFALRSGIIGFVISDKRLRLVINLAAASAAKLTISSKLLRQSEIVGPAPVRE